MIVKGQLSDIIAQLFDLPGGVSVATDINCKKIVHNAAAAKFLRINVGEDFSMSADVPPSVRAFDEHGRWLTADELTIQRAISEGKENKQVVELQWPDGVRKIAVWNSKPIFNEQGKIVGAISISEDITDYMMEKRRLRNSQEQLRIELEKLDRLNHVAQLAAGISHEVRNPLTTVKGFLQLMHTNKHAVDESIIAMMLEELDRANEIISDFLSLTKVQKTKLSQDNIVDVIDRLFPLLENDAFIARKKLVLKRNRVSDVMLDSKEVKQLILNLVRNAMEVTSAGGQVCIETFETESCVGLRVIDEGPGIPKQVIEKLGTPFVTTKTNGTGVGLAICYDIAKRHNAKIDVKTGSNGTTFSILFPKPEK
ncbi:ATP-binding protein [Paenibacillus hamazuiensis]|uniref:ATP-binding protein n=1 Tax=Paenibacillus hamazuiensis TaxID=2936508 RepID=UPI00200D2699|nr:ATP-binding protein [Paenibacillus hamazuiensis]